MPIKLLLTYHHHFISKVEEKLFLSKWRPDYIFIISSYNVHLLIKLIFGDIRFLNIPISLLCISVLLKEGKVP